MRTIRFYALLMMSGAAILFGLQSDMSHAKPHGGTAGVKQDFLLVDVGNALLVDINNGLLVGTCNGEVCLIQSKSRYVGDGPLTTATITPTGVNANNGTLVSVGGCTNANCDGTAHGTYNSLVVTGGTGSTTCAKVTGAEDTTSVFTTIFFYCPPGVGGSPTYTASMTPVGAGDFYYVGMAVSEWSGVNGVEGGNANNGNSASPTVTTSGTLSQTNGEAVVSVVNTLYGATPNLAGILASGEYQTTVGSPTTVTNTWASISQQWSAVIVAIKHF
jgi:hypothetical protein